MSNATRNQTIQIIGLNTSMYGSIEHVVDDFEARIFTFGGNVAHSF